MRKLLVLLLITVAGCYTNDFHMGRHDLQVCDSFEVDDVKHYVLYCLKQCPYRDTFPPMRLH